MYDSRHRVVPESNSDEYGDVVQMTFCVLFGGIQRINPYSQVIHISFGKPGEQKIQKYTVVCLITGPYDYSAHLPGQNFISF